MVCCPLSGIYLYPSHLCRERARYIFPGIFPRYFTFTGPGTRLTCVATGSVWQWQTGTATVCLVILKLISPNIPWHILRGSGQHPAWQPWGISALRISGHPGCKFVRVIQSSLKYACFAMIATDCQWLVPNSANLVVSKGMDIWNVVLLVVCHCHWLATEALTVLVFLVFHSGKFTHCFCHHFGDHLAQFRHWPCFMFQVLACNLQRSTLQSVPVTFNITVTRL